MRKTVVALVVALLALTLAGCGGGKTAAPETAVAPAGGEPVVAPSTEPSATDRSQNDSDVAPAPFPSFTTTVTPVAFKEKLDAHRPMLILFYDDTQQVTTDERTEVDAVMSEYRGLIDLVTFNVGGPDSDPNVLAAVTYARELRATNTPYILVVDGNGFIVWRCKGFAERGIIERQVQRATS